MNKHNDFKNRYLELLQSAEARLYDYLPSGEPRSLYEPFKYIMTGGGKRIRPVLTMIAAGAMCAKPEAAIEVAVAIEILHNFTLAHDDIMDNSPLRRGRATIHEKWDDSTAILTGDVMVGWAYRLLPNSSQSEQSDRINEEFTRALIEVCEGQALDTEFDHRSDVTCDEYFAMITQKTARLLEAAAVIGGLVAGGKGEQIEILRQYANNLGLAFQIQDDLLDSIANEEAFGKRIGQDIIEGKKTYLIHAALSKNLGKDDRDLMDKFFLHHGLDGDDLLLMKSLLERNGVFEETASKADELFDAAVMSLRKLENNFYVEMLQWLVSFLRRRVF